MCTEQGLLTFNKWITLMLFGQMVLTWRRNYNKEYFGTLQEYNMRNDHDRLQQKTWELNYE